MKELRKITWTKPKELLSNFFVVLGFSTVVTAIVYGIDVLSVAVQQALMSFF